MEGERGREKHWSLKLCEIRTRHPGVLVAKVRYFDPKSAKVPPGQMGTKPAKVGHLAANLLKYVPPPVVQTPV